MSWVPWDGLEVGLGRRGARGRWNLEAGVGGASVYTSHLRQQVHVKSPREGMGDGKKEGLMASWRNSVSQGLDSLSRPGEKVQPGGWKSAQGGHLEGQQQLRGREQGGPVSSRWGEAERAPRPQHCCSDAYTSEPRHLPRHVRWNLLEASLLSPQCSLSGGGQTPLRVGFCPALIFPLSVVLEHFGPWGHFGDQWLTVNVIAVSSL